jgi:D-glycero-alpha-D-manno-heptose-7-phosphate kinase
MNSTVIASAPYRVSLFGGGTDYPAWFEKYGGKTISFAIDKYCHVSFRKLPNFFWHKYRIVYSKTESCNKISEIKHPTVRNVLNFFKIKDGVEIHHFSDLPARSGIGSSSAFTVALITAISKFYNFKLSKKRIAEYAILIEQKKNKEYVGNQDQVITSYGGFKKIIFEKKIFKVSDMNLVAIKKIKNNSLLLFTGKSRTADKIAKSKVENIKNKTSITPLMKIKNICEKAEELMSANTIDLKAIGSLLSLSWENKKKLSKKVNNKLIDQYMNLIFSENVYGAKVLGAGGGGFIFILAKKKLHKRIIEKTRLLNISFDLDKSGAVCSSM